jgi:hypothetical protein
LQEVPLKRLLRDDLTSPIAGVTNRLRLNVAVAFPSKAIAAKVLTGVHVGTDRWRMLVRAGAAFDAG